MQIKILITALCAAAIFMTFKCEWILKTVFKMPEPSDKAKITVKLIALLIAVVLFIMVFRV